MSSLRPSEDHIKQGVVEGANGLQRGSGKESREGREGVKVV